MIMISDLEFWLPSSPLGSCGGNPRQSQCTKIATIEAVTPVTERL
jgi:hypothetical protein